MGWGSKGTWIACPFHHPSPHGAPHSAATCAALKPRPDLRARGASGWGAGGRVRGGTPPSRGRQASLPSPSFFFPALSTHAPLHLSGATHSSFPHSPSQPNSPMRVVSNDIIRYKLAYGERGGGSATRVIPYSFSTSLTPSPFLSHPLHPLPTCSSLSAADGTNNFLGSAPSVANHTSYAALVATSRNMLDVCQQVLTDALAWSRTPSAASTRGAR